MIENLDKHSKREESNSLPFESRDFFNRRLIKPDLKKYYSKLFGRHYKCLICYDSIFDPVHCSGCKLVFCRTCLSKNGSDEPDGADRPKGDILQCDHNKLKHSNKLPELEKEKFEKIKLDCFFNCGSTFDLLSYPSHIEFCKQKYELTRVNQNNLRKENNSHKYAEQIQSILLEKIKAFTESQNSQFKTKEKESQNLLYKIIEMRKDIMDYNQNMLKMESIFIEKEEITVMVTKQLFEVKEMLQKAIKKNASLIKKKEEQNEKNLILQASLLKELNLEKMEREKFESSSIKIKSRF